MSSSRRPQSVSVRLLAGVILAGTLSVLDSTIVVPLLGAIGSEFGGGTAVSWLVAAYLLASTVTIPLWGRWMDLRGERAPMWAALACFAAGTVISATAPSLGVLILGRVVQGLGAGGVVPLGQAILAARCGSEERARLQVYYNVAYGMAAGLGPLVGGALLHVSWRWAFWLILPFIAAVAWLLAGEMRHEPHGGAVRPFDAVGSAILTVGLTVLLVGIERTWPAWIVSGAMLVAAFLVWSRRHRDGLIPTAILSSRTIMSCAFLGLLIGFVQFAFLTYLPLLSQRLNPDLNSGLVVIPLTVLWMTLGAFTSVLALRTGTRVLALVAVALGVAAGVVVALWFALGVLFVASALVGISAGLVLLPALLLAQHAAPNADVGAATSTFVLLRNFGGAMGVVAAAVVLQDHGVGPTMWMLAAVASLGLVPVALMPGLAGERLIRDAKDVEHAHAHV